MGQVHFSRANMEFVRESNGNYDFAQKFPSCCPYWGMGVCDCSLPQPLASYAYDIIYQAANDIE